MYMFYRQLMSTQKEHTQFLELGLQCAAFPKDQLVMDKDKKWASTEQGEK